MWSEELNNKIKQAPESHAPEYNESAWVKMEALLNKHLPLKKDSRKKLLYIFLLCFFIIGGTLLLNKEWNWRTPDQDLKPTKEKSAIANEKKLIIESKNTSSLKDPKAVKNFAYSNRLDKKNLTVLSKTKLATRSILHTQNPYAINEDEKKSVIHQKEIVKNGQLSGAENKEQDKTELSLQNHNEKLIIIPVISQKQILKDSLTNNVESDKTNDPASTDVTRKKIANKKFISRFSFSASAGPDASGVGLNNLGKATMSYGAGIGYNVNKRFAIKSGLYVADKIYSAAPGDYDPPASYWTYNVDLKRVDADCKVYEIPLTVYYSFKEKNHHHWFAALGSSSYLMKKETYNYLYKTQTGYLYRGWSLENKNKHYFSVITLSGGYAYRLNKTFSLIAEPYAKIPIQGLGYGKVKLKSTGIMFTISATPF